MKPTYLIINFLKNFVHNLPNVYVAKGNNKLVSFVEKLARLLRVELNAEVISENGTSFGILSSPNYGHDTAINPIIVWLLVIGIVLALFKIRKIKWKELYQSYSLVATFAFLLFCMVLRWEFFVTRYMLAFLALLCPMIAYQLQKHTEGKYLLTP